jgi:hypothetical protein
MASIAIIDYGMGNLRSVAKALEQVAPAVHVLVTHRPEDILQADRVVFPGQGAIGDCMQALRQWQLVDVVRQVAANKPFLGLCLGPQALLEFSEENGGTPPCGIPSRLSGSRFRTWAGIRCIRPWRIRSGPVFPRTVAFISSTVIIYNRLQRLQRLKPVISSPLPRPLPRTISLLCNFIRKKALMRVCGCWPISSAGTRPRA